MSINSKREQIILQIIRELNVITSISHVKRVRPSLDDLASFPTTMLPLIAVECSLPKPIQKKSSRVPGKIDLFISELEVSLFCYAIENVNPDVLISNLADDIWHKMYEDPLHNELCLETDMMPTLQTAIWNPYIALTMKTTLIYIHDIGGI